MANNGWIKIDRGILNHWIYQDMRTFQWWFDLIVNANWTDGECKDDGHTFILKRGQLCASVSFLANRWGLTDSTALRFLKRLEADGMIKREVKFRKTAVITICNYDKYQGNKVKTLTETLTEGITETLMKTLNTDKDKALDYLVETLTETQAKTLTKTIAEINKRIKRNKEEKNNIIIHPNGCKSSEDDPSKTEENNQNQNGLEKGKDDDEEMKRNERERKEIEMVSEVAEYWNQAIEKTKCGIKKIQIVQGTRLDLLRARLKQYSVEQIKIAIDKTMNSSFMNGQNSRGWTATFDWVMRPNNLPKVLEGNYDDKEQNQIQTLITLNNNGHNNYISRDDRRKLEKAKRDAETEQLVASLIADIR